jgi:hypothetical protein
MQVEGGGGGANTLVGAGFRAIGSKLAVSCWVTAGRPEPYAGRWDQESDRVALFFLHHGAILMKLRGQHSTSLRSFFLSFLGAKTLESLELALGWESMLQKSC